LETSLREFVFQKGKFSLKKFLLVNQTLKVLNRKIFPTSTLKKKLEIPKPGVNLQVGLEPPEFGKSAKVRGFQSPLAPSSHINLK